MRKLKPGQVPQVASVVFVGVDRKAQELLQETLGADALLHAEIPSFDDAIATLQRLRPHVVIAGLDVNPEAALAFGLEMRRIFPEARAIAQASVADPNFIRDAMRHGYGEYVVLPEDGEMLRRAVREAAYANDAQEEAGRLVSICGSKGGSGVTLLTANLAAELASFHRVVALDFDFTMGDMAPYLDLTVQSNLQDLMKSIARLDDRMLGGSVLVHPSKLHVLAQPIEPSQGTEVSELSAVSLLRACARMYQFVLADCGSKGDPIALTTLLVSDLVLLICTPDVPSVRNAWRRVCLMERIGVERERIRLVVNRWTRAAPISLGEIRENLGMEIACTISNDSKTAIQATNDGRLLRDVNPRSRAARDIARMVDLATEERRAIDLDEGGGLLGRLFS